MCSNLNRLHQNSIQCRFFWGSHATELLIGSVCIILRKHTFPPHVRKVILLVVLTSFIQHFVNAAHLQRPLRSSNKVNVGKTRRLTVKHFLYSLNSAEHSSSTPFPRRYSENVKLHCETEANRNVLSLYHFKKQVS